VGLRNGYSIMVECGLVLSGSGQGLVAGSCEHGNVSLGSVKGGEFLE
jgi:hypothetical protein